MRTPRRTLVLALTTIGAALASAAVLATAATAAAAPAGTQVAAGLHAPAGTLVDPDGRTWVADRTAGFCRLTDPTATDTGHIDHPAHAGAPGPRTCLGGRRADAGAGPAVAGRPTFVDPTPAQASSGDELALIPDASVTSAEVTRARWNPGTKLFEPLDTVTMLGGRAGPTAAATDQDGNVYVTFDRDPTIQRITDPAGTPGVEVVGRTADGRGTAAVAAGRDADGIAVWVAESTGIRRLTPDAGAPATTAPSYRIAGAAAAAGPARIAALAYDETRQVLWAGSADATAAEPAIDRVSRIDVVTSEVVVDRAGGFGAIGGIAVRPDGLVDVVDDPAQTPGLARLHRVGRPVAHVVRGPIADAGEGADGSPTRDATPSFEVSGEGTVQCLLRGPGQTGDWTDCPAGGIFRPGAALADGDYGLSIRAVPPAGEIGLAEVRAFTVDTHAPLPPSILRPTSGVTVGARPSFAFDGEPGATFECRFDGEPAGTPCSPGRIRTYTTGGDHRLEVVAIDAAGNRSGPSGVASFTADPALPEAAPVLTGAPRHRGSSLAAEGLELPTGAIVDPDGHTWVADQHAGFCRVTPSDADGPGRIDHPQRLGGPGPRTCLGGLLPEAAPGAEISGAPAFVDPTPEQPGNGDEVVLIPDSAPGSSSVVRARWNAGTARFDELDTVALISTVAAGVRPVAAGAGEDGEVYVVSQGSDTVQRIARAAGATPTVEVVGRTLGAGARAVAAGRDAAGLPAVYIGEAQLTQLRPSAVRRPTAKPSFTLAGAPAIGALAYDRANGQLLVGTAAGTTARAAGTDVVQRVTVADGTVDAAYGRGYSMVGGLGVRPDGLVFVLDDPALLDPAQPFGQGRLHLLGLPAAHVALGPLQPDGTASADRGAIASHTPGFDVTATEGVAQCRLRGSGALSLDTGWTPCGARFTPPAPLAEGAYVLAVRAVEGDVTGLVEVHRFDVDVTAPAKPQITSPAATVDTARPWFAFDAEPGATFSCRWELAGAWEPCAPGRLRTFSEDGAHVLEIRAIDRARNASPTSDPLRFTVKTQVTRVTIESGPSGRTRDDAPVFTFSADLGSAELACRLVGRDSAFAPCLSPTSYAGLADGTYTFQVRGRDAAGNVTPPAARTFTVDRTGPTLRSDTADDTTLQAADRIGIASGDEAATLRCGIDDGAIGACDSAVALDGMAPGDHVLRVQGTDDLGNVGAVLIRRFRIVPAPTPGGGGATTAPSDAPAPAATPAPDLAPTVVTRPSGKGLTVRIRAMRRTIRLRDARRTGLVVEVVPAGGTELLRLRIMRATGRGRPVLTVFKKAPRGGATIRLTHQQLRRLGPGRYTLEVAPAATRTDVGKAVTQAFRVTR